MPEWMTIVLIIILATVAFGVGAMIGWGEGRSRGLKEGRSRGEFWGYREGTYDLQLQAFNVAHDKYEKRQIDAFTLLGFATVVAEAGLAVRTARQNEEEKSTS